ncbi:MAG TPA: hypothetical protein VEH51_04695 [Burkholderiales bacterium]|nr:hypothetical protein [Burkholderiales bacterium]
MEHAKIQTALPIVETFERTVTRYLSGLADEDDTLRALREMSGQLDRLLDEGRARELLRAIEKHTSMVFEPPESAKTAAFPLPYISFVRIQLAKHVWALKEHLRESATA